MPYDKLDDEIIKIQPLQLFSEKWKVTISVYVLMVRTIYCMHFEGFQHDSKFDPVLR